MLMMLMFNCGLQCYIVDSNSVLLGLQLEDWLDMVELVNISGISYQYKNWWCKFFVMFEMMFVDDGVNKLLKDLDRWCRVVVKKKQSVVDVGCDVFGSQCY